MNHDQSIEEKHAEMVEILTKPGHTILPKLCSFDIDLIHMALGISGEAGELLDAIKKYTIYRKELDRENLMEELGDLEFYMGRLRGILGISRTQTLAHNMDKLAKRYAGFQYSDQQAQERADKQ